MIKQKFSCNDIVKEIECYIVDNCLKKDTLLATSMQLAEKFNVSEKTIHRAMNILIKNKLIYRVQGCGTFVLNDPKPKIRRNVALLRCKSSYSNLPTLDYLSNGAFIDELCNNFNKEQNCSVNLIVKQLELANKNEDLSLEHYDCIIAEGDYAKKYHNLYNFAKKTILTQDEILSLGQFNQVAVDYLSGFLKAIRYFQERKVSKLIVFGITCNIDNHRYKVLEKAMQIANFPIYNVVFHESKDQRSFDTKKIGEDCAKEYLQKYRNYAILSLSDYITYGIISSFKENNLVAGEDMPFVGYDNFLSKIPEFKDIKYPTISYPTEKKLDAIMYLYKKIIKNEEQNFNQIILVDANNFQIRGKK